MYVISNTKSNTDKIVAAFLTSAFLFGFYFFLQRQKLPQVKLKTDTYEEINWSRFKPQPQKVIDKPQPVKVKEPLQIEKPPLPLPQPKSVEKIDLSALNNLALADLNQPKKSLKKPTLKSEPSRSTSGGQMKVNLKKSQMLAGLNILLDNSSRKLNIQSRGQRGKSQNASGVLSVKSGQGLDVGNEINYAGGSRSLGTPEAKTVGGGDIQISELDLSELGTDYSDLTPVYRALVEWMKQHPTAFPEVVGRFMEKSPQDLTSIVQFKIGNRQFQLYLLCKEKLYEVRICLLEGHTSTYLIDRGFKEKSRFLRVGTVNRSQTGAPLAFSTVRQAASNQRTQQFYQIFLSWWESVN
ncbi:MAG: hypothetical protein ACE5HS_04845 [bacterium]